MSNVNKSLEFHIPRFLELVSAGFIGAGIGVLIDVSGKLGTDLDFFQRIVALGPLTSFILFMGLILYVAAHFSKILKYLIKNKPKSVKKNSSKTFNNKHILSVSTILILLANLVMAYSSLQNIELTKNLVEKKASMTISLQNTTGLVAYGNTCWDSSEDREGNLTLINTGYRPIVLGEVSRIYEICGNRSKEIGVIRTNFNVLEIEKVLKLTYIIPPYYMFEDNYCKIIFNVKSEDGEIEGSKTIENVTVETCFPKTIN